MTAELNNDLSEPYCGYVAIVGRPNVGKSTLLNNILGIKISITSRKPQTTRHTVLGIKTDEAIQTIYVDTPGLQYQQQNKMHRLMNKSVFATAQEVDVVVMVVEGLTWNKADEDVLSALQHVSAPLILVINKVDRLQHKSQLLPHIQKLATKRNFTAIIPLSARQLTDVGHLEKEVKLHLPKATHHFDKDELTDRPERFLVGEIVREKIMRQLGEEVPYEMAVEVESFQKNERLVEIHCLILVDKEGQKRIVIGNQGSRIKRIGEDARKDIEVLLQQKVLLKLWVKVKSGWADSDRALKSLGIE